MTETANTVRKLEQPEKNNFNLLRLLLATLVVLGHFKGFQGGKHYGLYSYADFAVHAFFIVSGFLIAWSYFKDKNLITFYVRRFFRIYPLYFIIIFVQAGIMLWLLGGISGYIPETIKYLVTNLAFANFLSHDIGGVFSNLKDPGINASLWTLKIEVAFYITLPFLCMLYLRYRFLSLLLIYAASTAYYLYFTAHDMDELAKQIPGQLRFFVVGMYLYIIRDKIILPKYTPGALAIVMMLLCTYLRYDPYFNLIYPVAIGLLVFICAVRLPAIPLKFDISYGVYLLHAPVIQVLIYFGLLKDNIWYLIGLLAGVYILAFITENLIEKPFIKHGKNLSKMISGYRSGAKA